MQHPITLMLILALLMTNHQNIQAQLSIGVVIGGVGYHPKQSTNNTIYKWTLDKKHQVVGFGGISFAVSYRMNPYLGLRYQQAIIIHDCAGKLAGVTHLGIELYDDILGWSSPIHEVSASLGPLWYYRRGWNTIPEYTPDPKFMRQSPSKLWETTFVWHGGQIEYTYALNQRQSLALNVLPGHPYLYTSGIGIKSLLW